MQVKISVRHGHLSPEHQSEIQEKAGKLLHFFDRINFIEVTVDLQHEIDKQVEVIATAEDRHEFVGRHHDADLHVALNGAVDKAKQQIKHHKERVQDHRRDPSHNQN